MTDHFRRLVSVGLILTSVLFGIGATVSVTEEFEVSGFKNYNLSDTDATFTVTVTEYVATNGEPAAQSEIELDPDNTLETSNLSKKLFNVTLFGNMANAATVSVKCSGMIDRSDRTKYIPVTLTASMTKSREDYHYTQIKEREYQYGILKYYYIFYYYRYYNRSTLSVPETLNESLNKAGGSSQVDINWYITKAYYKTSYASSDLNASDSDVPADSLGEQVAYSGSGIVGCPVRNNGVRMEFTDSVDFSLGITSEDWLAYKQNGHTYSMDFDIFIVVAGV